MKLSTLLLSAAFALAVQSELITRGSSSLTPTSTGKGKNGNSQSTASSSSATPSPTYPHGYPLCGIPNTSLHPGPGNAVPATHQQSGSNLKVCVQQCRADVGDAGRGQCASILFEDRYTMCLFYDVRVENTTQVDDGRFRFQSFDKDCYVDW